MRKLDPNKINLIVKSVGPFARGDESGFVISWSSDVGFGQYTIISRPSLGDPAEHTWIAESEGMDDIDDQSLGRKLLELWMDQVIIVD